MAAFIKQRQSYQHQMQQGQNPQGPMASSQVSALTNAIGFNLVPHWSTHSETSYFFNSFFTFFSNPKSAHVLAHYITT